MGSHLTKYTIFLSKTYKRELDKLSKIDQKRVLEKMSILKKNPSHPSLRTKKMRDGTGRYESSVNMDIRIIWQFDDEEDKLIVALDVGHHDVLMK